MLKDLKTHIKYYVRAGAFIIAPFLYSYLLITFSKVMAPLTLLLLFLFMVVVIGREMKQAEDRANRWK